MTKVGAGSVSRLLVRMLAVLCLVAAILAGQALADPAGPLMESGSGDVLVDARGSHQDGVLRDGGQIIKAELRKKKPLPEAAADDAEPPLPASAPLQIGVHARVAVITSPDTAPRPARTVRRRMSQGPPLEA
jgi:hypothetical protein